MLLLILIYIIHEVDSIIYNNDYDADDDDDDDDGDNDVMYNA